jgi:uncharacterized protein (TIGR00251 family)
MARPAGTPWSSDAAGVLVSVRLTPRSARDAIDGVEELADGRLVLKARVRAVPEAGKANAALMRLLAKTLHVPATSVSLAAGASARTKTVRIAAAPSVAETVIEALARMGAKR